MKSGLFAVPCQFSCSELELACEGLVAAVDDELEGAGECGGQGDLAVEVDECSVYHYVALHNLNHTSHARCVECEGVVLDPYLRGLYWGFVASSPPQVQAVRRRMESMNDKSCFIICILHMIAPNKSNPMAQTIIWRALHTSDVHLRMLRSTV